jgi:hypothetical protein
MDLQNCNGENQHQLTTPTKTRPARNRIQQRHQAAALERFAFDAAISLRAACIDKETGTLTMTPQMATAIYRLIGAWDTAADRLRVLRGKGLPASVKSRAARSPTLAVPLDPA